MKETDHDALQLRNRVLNLFTQSAGVLTQKNFVNEFKDVALTEILPILNSLQKEGLLDVLVNQDRTLSWKLRDHNVLNKIKQLSDIEESLVYNAIRKTGEDGSTLRFIGQESKLPQNKISRILKSLISKLLIKELPTATGQKQKVYLLYDINPSKKLAATTLFAGENGVDVEFISMLRAAILKYFRDKGNASLHLRDPLEAHSASFVSVEEIHRFIINSKICTVAMSSSDVKLVLDALMYGGELEARPNSLGSLDNLNSVYYRIASKIPSAFSLAKIPCTVCLCQNDCTPGGAISPENCKLLNAFLDF